MWHVFSEMKCVSIYSLSGSIPKSLQQTVKRQHSKWTLHFECRHRCPSLPRGVRASDWQCGTFMGIPHKVPSWLMAQPRAPPSLHSSVLIYSSSLCDLALALPTTSPVETPCGHIHYYLVSQWAQASDRNIQAHTHTQARAHTHTRTHTHGLCWRAGEPPTASTLKRSLTQRAQHAWWARGLSGSVSLPSEELVRVCMRTILTNTHTHTERQTDTHPVCVNLAGFSLCQSAVYDPCLPVRIFIKRST